MWSSSPADRILSVPPFVSHVTGVGGGAVEMVDGDEVPPASEEDDDAQPAARTARLRSAAAPNPTPTPPFRGLNAFIVVPPFLERCAWLVGAGVERVAHAISEEVEGEHGEDESHAREREVPPGGVED